MAQKNNSLSYNNVLALAAGATGALLFTFTDSFWFSAVEAEVYALSSLFTAIIVWAILRWERVADTQQGWRWLIFIAYLIGLSIGVHLLGLVTLPAIALLYYYRKWRIATRWGVVAALSVGLGLVGLVMIGLIQGLPAIAIQFDLFFVNVLGFSFGSGIISFFLLMIATLVYLLYRTQANRQVIGSTIVLSLCFILIGYSSYTMVLIRSGHDPPIDENNPEEAFSFLSYLRREQYGDRPLFRGPHFEAKLQDQKRTSPTYRKGAEKYEVSGWEIESVYDKKDMMPLPRIYSKRGAHAKVYRQVLDLSAGEKPSFIDNLHFLFSYQLGHMYVRYLLWNYAGRSSDEQHADWLAPWNYTDPVPQEIANNKARNQYWLLPLLLGFGGLWLYSKKDPKGFAYVLTLFLLMGAGLVLYLNMTPAEPRERDYIYLGSYYAYAIWVGMGLLFVVEIAQRNLKFLGTRLSKRTALGIGGVISLTAITLVAVENWDDHDRSNRYFSVDSAINLLESCAPNAILFTGGDNDTFPLWYAQEVEEVRTDVRVVVLSYFNTDWYIEQMMQTAHKSKPLPFTIPLSLYVQGGANDILYVAPREEKEKQRVISLQGYLSLIRKEDSRISIQSMNNPSNYVPGGAFFLQYDSTQTQGLLPEQLEHLRTDRVIFPLNGRYLEKKDLAILDLISAKQWDRPLYFNHTSLQQLNFDIEDYIVQEGVVFRYLPIKKEKKQTSFYESQYLVDTKRMYENIMQKYQWRGLQDQSIYLSGDYRGFMYNHRSVINSLCFALMDEGQPEKAHEVLRFSLEKMPNKTLAHNHISLPMVSIAFQLDDIELGKQIGTNIANGGIERVEYALSNPQLGGVKDLERQFALINQVILLFRREGLEAEADILKQRMSSRRLLNTG